MFPEGFDDWCTAPFPGGENERLSFTDFESNDPNQSRDAMVELFLERSRTRNVFWPSIQIEPNKISWNSFTWKLRDELPAVPSAEQKCDVWNLQIGGRVNEFTLTGVAVHYLVLAPSQTTVFRVNNCLIGYLHFPGAQPAEVELTDCIIGTLQLGAEGQVKRLEIRGGAIANIACPTPSQKNPFSGSVRFGNVGLPTSKTQTKLFKDPQGYRNLLVHMEKLNNLITANKIRAKQMQAEREDDKGVALFINWGYGTFANYGTSPGRPLAWIFGLYVIVAVIAYLADASSLSSVLGHEADQYMSFSDPQWGRLNRAWLLPLQSAVNPFGVFFDSRKTLIPSSVWWGFALTVYGVISDLLLLMFIFCIRRRFKVS